MSVGGVSRGLTHGIFVNDVVVDIVALCEWRDIFETVITCEVSEF